MTSLLTMLREWLGRSTVYRQKLKMPSNVGKAYLTLDALVTRHISDVICVEKGAEELSLNIKDMIRSYIIISIEVSRENLHSVYIIKHVSTCWLSLGKCLERMLTELDALKSYFVSNFDLNDDAYDNEENDNTKSEEEM